MKRLLIIMAVALCTVSCIKPEEPSLADEFSVMVGTKSSNPFDGTIWECVTGEKYNRYLYFEDGNVSLFYGFVNTWEYEPLELQRWSPFYTSVYYIGKDGMTASLEYPNYGEEKAVHELSLMRLDGTYSMATDDGLYIYYGNDASCIQEQWMRLYVTIEPWREE